MPDTRWRKVWRDLMMHRARSALVVLALAAALTAAGTIGITWVLVRTATIEGYRASLPASATFRLADVEAPRMAAVLQMVRAQPGIAAARARRIVGAAVQGQGRSHGALLVGVEADARDPEGSGANGFDDGRLGLLRLEQGPWPPGRGALAIERSSLEFSGAVIGEGLSVRGGTGGAESRSEVSATATGVVRDVSLAPGWMENTVVAFGTRQTLADLGLGSAFNELQIRVADATDVQASRDEVRRIAGSLGRVLQREGLTVLALEVPEPGQHVHARQMNSLLFTQAAFALLALAVSALLVVNLMAAVLARQGRQMAVMKVLGARVRDLAAMVLAQAAALGAAAALLALPLAAWLGRRYGAMKGELLNFPIDSFPTPLWPLALLGLLAVVWPTLAVAPLVRQACRASVADGLRDIGIVARGAAIATRRVLGLHHWPRPLVLALSNALRRRQRLLFTLLALAAGGAVLVAADNLKRSVQASVDLLFATQGWQLTLRLAQPQPAAQLLALAGAVEGVREVEAWHTQRVQRAGTDGLPADSLRLVGVPLPSSLLRPAVLAGRWLQPGDGRALVLSRSLALDQDDLQPGRELTLVVEGQPQRWLIVGLADSGPQPLAYAPRGSLSAAGTPAGADLAGTLIVALQASSAAGQLETALRLREALAAAGLPVAGSQLQAENRRVVEDHLLMVVDFLALMGWVMMAVGALALASTMGLAVLERQREIGVQRVLGASSAMVMGLIQAEGALVSLMAWVLCLPLAAPMAGLLGEAFGRVMFRVPVTVWPEPGLALRWLALMLLVSAGACAVPAWRAMRQPPARALAYEG